MKALQLHSDESLAIGQQMSTAQIAQFLEDFRLIHASNPANQQPSKLISLKVPEALLNTFRHQCQLHGLKYQSHIKTLMRDWLIAQNKKA